MTDTPETDQETWWVNHPKKTLRAQVEACRACDARRLERERDAALAALRAIAPFVEDPEYAIPPSKAAVEEMRRVLANAHCPATEERGS